LKNKPGTLLLAVVLATAVPAFADSIPGHSRSGSNFVSFSEGLTDQQDSQASSARCNFLVSSVKEEGSKTSSFSPASFSEFAKGEKGANFGVYLSTGMGSDIRPPTVTDFGGNEGASSDKNDGKDKGKHNGTDGDGNGTGVGSGVPDPSIPIAEPGSQTLLLVGLAGLGMVFSRRRTLTNAI
jgi:hypothetical protein